ncbi:MAG: type III secretion system ATPase SctN [Spartobacteria bacterium]
MTAAEPLAGYFQRLRSAGAAVVPRRLSGQITQVAGVLVKALLPGVQVGELCEVWRPGAKEPQFAEVIGFSGSTALLMPVGDYEGLCSNTEVRPTGTTHKIKVGEGLLGRVLDGLGNFLDTSAEPFVAEAEYPVNALPPDPLSRGLVEHPLSLGLRAMDGLLTCGEGQRIGIFAAAGGGKSTLLSQILRNTEAEVVVLALIGERGREVREFLEMVLDEESRKRAVVVVSTSDRPAIERLKSAHVATTVAEYFRDKGKKVLLMLDSVTRFARAQRSIGLAAGEPPARRGFPPSVFNALPALLERAGPAEKGSITAIYTVLVEGDDMNEPVADEVRSILDGHVILSRRLASAYHYPAIDVLESVSRVMGNVVDDAHKSAAGKVRDMLARYRDTELLIRIGEYKKGSDPATDEAIEKNKAINDFLKQKLSEKSTYQDALEGLKKLAGI